MLRLAAIALTLILLTAACDDSSDLQTLAITIEQDGCTPASFEVDAGRPAKLAVENESDVAYVIRDADGRLDEINVESGEAAEAFLDVPDGDAKYILLCEGTNGAFSEIALQAASGFAEPTKAVVPGGDTLAVTLLDFEIAVSAPTIAGRHMFIATNVSDTSTHDLHVMRLQPDGTYEDVGQIAPIAPQQGGSVTIDLEPGTYRLACLIEVGEFGSTVDHYQQGMWLDLDVRPTN